jgi:hypothetical protein
LAPSTKPGGELPSARVRFHDPPYFLDVQPTSAVLDMCVAPGAIPPNGGEWLVIANEIEVKRFHDLVRQLQRIGTERCIVTCQPAEIFDVGDVLSIAFCVTCLARVTARYGKTRRPARSGKSQEGYHCMIVSV